MPANSFGEVIQTKAEAFFKNTAATLLGCPDSREKIGAHPKKDHLTSECHWEDAAGTSQRPWARDHLPYCDPFPPTTQTVRSSQETSSPQRATNFDCLLYLT